MTTPLLFEVPIQESPFLKWKREHKVQTHFWEHATEHDEKDWMATPPGVDFGFGDLDEYGAGDSEIEACYDVAKNFKLPWFQKVETVK